MTGAAAKPASVAAPETERIVSAELNSPRFSSLPSYGIVTTVESVGRTSSTTTPSLLRASQFAALAKSPSPDPFVQTAETGVVSAAMTMIVPFCSGYSPASCSTPATLYARTWTVCPFKSSDAPSATDISFSGVVAVEAIVPVIFSVPSSTMNPRLRSTEPLSSPVPDPVFLRKPEPASAEAIMLSLLFSEQLEVSRTAPRARTFTVSPSEASKQSLSFPLGL